MAQVGGIEKGRRTWLAALAALIAVAAIAQFAPAASAAAWTPAVELSEAGKVGSGAQVGVDSKGDVTAAWVSEYPVGPIKSAYLPAGGSWEPIQTPISSSCSTPSLAVSAGGSAVLVADCGAGKMRAAYRVSATAAWGSAVEISGTENSVEPVAAIDDAGNAIFVFDRENETVASAYRLQSTATWGATQPVSVEGGAGNTPEARVAMEPGGYAVVAWSDKEGTNTYVVQGAFRGPGSGSAWIAYKKLSPTTSGNEAFSPEIAYNAEGLVVAWEQRVSSERFAIDNDWGGGCEGCTWGEDAANHEGGTTDRSVESPAVAIDAQGRSTAVWRADEVPASTGKAGIQSAGTSSINALWGTPATLLEAGEDPYEPVFAPSPQIAADGPGNVTAVWSTTQGVYAARHSPGASFETPVPISNADGVETSMATKFPTPVAMDPNGDAFAAWSTAGSPERVAFAMRDGSPPTLSGLLVPVSGATGKAVTMTATASDVWSPPTTIHWDFGDGTNGSGDSVGHAYSAPGTYTVAVTASDAQGNVSTAQTRQIAVTGSGGETKKPAVVVQLSVAKQTWKAIAKAKAIKVKCGLDVSGTCAVAATIGAGAAKALGLHAKGGKPVSLGRGSLAVTGKSTGTVKVKLTKKALKAIGAATKSVGVALTATGSAPGHRAGSQTKKLKIKRP